MTSGMLLGARRDFHRALQSRLWSRREDIPSNSDKDNATSVGIGLALAEAVGVTLDRKRLGGSAAGTEFERRTRDFLAATFPQLKHKSTAPTMWLFTNSRKSWRPEAGGTRRRCSRSWSTGRDFVTSPTCRLTSQSSQIS